MPRHAPTSVSPPLLTASLCFVILTVSTQQTIVMPLAGVIRGQLGIGTTAIGWVLTAAFLSAAVATPVAGRLADLRRKRTVLVSVLLIVLVGSLVAAVTESAALLITGRVLQGVSFAAFPVCLAILREEVPAHRLPATMGLLSGTLGFGGALGMVMTGLVVPAGADYRRAFWLATALTAVALVSVVVLVPLRSATAGGPVDWVGAVVLGCGLILALLPLAEGANWGWLAPPTLACAGAGLAVLAGWFVLERRTAHPLVPTEMLTRRPVVTTHLAGLLVGGAMFLNLTALVYFAQTTRAVAGYGFDASPMQSALGFVLPGATAGVVASICSGALITRFGARAVMVLAGAMGVTGFGCMIVAHDAAWQLIVGSMIATAFTSLAYAAMPALLVAEVRPDRTGVANSVNSIARTTGSSIGSALLATLLVAYTGHDDPFARVDAYVVVYGVGAACAVAATLCVLAGTTRVLPGTRLRRPAAPGRGQSASLASMSRADSADLGSHSTS